jgi:hypothetical protein
MRHIAHTDKFVHHYILFTILSMSMYLSYVVSLLTTLGFFFPTHYMIPQNNFFFYISHFDLFDG